VLPTDGQSSGRSTARRVSFPEPTLRPYTLDVTAGHPDRAERSRARRSDLICNTRRGPTEGFLQRDEAPRFVHAERVKHAVDAGIANG